MRQHPLDSTLQGHAARATSSTTTLELEPDDPILLFEPLELDIPAVFLDGRSDPGVQEFLDHGDDLGIRIQDLGILRPIHLARIVLEEVLARRKVFHQDAKDLGLEDAPRLSIVLADRDEIGSVKDRGDPLDTHQTDSER